MLPNTNRVEIKLNYGELKPVLTWCERNCSGEWAYDVYVTSGEGKGEYEFYFEEEKDLVAFKIWKT